MTKKTKNFITAPLPFMGQKRNFLKDFNKALENYPDNAIYVDLFGGSGLLSHTVKQLYPKARVIYNDYDNFSKRLQNIAKTNALLADIRVILEGYPKDKKIDDPYKSAILSRLELEDKAGFVDWITISSSILFSGKYHLNLQEFQKATLYNTIRMSDYSADGYLEGVERVADDYKKIFQAFKDNECVVFLVDPPYLSTDVKAYKSYWKLADYLDVLTVLDGTRYFYFTSNKSSIIELCEWIENSTVGNPFKDANRSFVTNSVNFNATYTDIMVFK
ncbi:DNA adenine methylase [Flavobacterium sp. N1994]|uniref:DNA adenine methylase n=1 Tax=Flavobacterium sp. N1994 TaxID=2986827 RepID=UPI0022212EAE|nr:DNA adenine methylase [Flavobacterium sp. N1994]